MVLVKEVFSKAKTLAKDDKLVKELEKAFENWDLAKVRDLLGEAENLNNYLPKNCEILFKGGSYNFYDRTTNELIGLFEIREGFIEIAIFRKGLKTEI